MESQCELSVFSCVKPYSYICLRDIWAIGVITYFLLCGYTPFDRDSNLEEMQAILAGDYSFNPAEYWRGISDTARDFIRRCLITDPKERMTAHEALKHAWLNPPYNSDGQQGRAAAGENLLPTVKKNFNARRTLHRAIDTVRAINKLREGGHLMMDGVMSVDPTSSKGNGNGNGSQLLPQEHKDDRELSVKSGGDGDAMEIDSHGDARGQTPQQSKAQEQKVKEVVSELWSKSVSQRA